MKKLIYLLSVIGLAFVLFSSCWVKKPVSREQPVNNKDYKVDYLFEYDGCKVYRFMDDGEYVYFTNCTGSVSSFKDDSTSAKVQTIVTRKTE